MGLSSISSLPSLSSSGLLFMYLFRVSGPIKVYEKDDSSDEAEKEKGDEAEAAQKTAQKAADRKQEDPVAGDVMDKPAEDTASV